MRRQAADSQLGPCRKVHAVRLRSQTALSSSAQAARPISCRNRRHGQSCHPCRSSLIFSGRCVHRVPSASEVAAAAHARRAFPAHGAPRRALADGQMLIVFPEGSRGESEQLQSLKGGIARLARATRWFRFSCTVWERRCRKGGAIGAVFLRCVYRRTVGMDRRPAQLYTTCRRANETVGGGREFPDVGVRGEDWSDGVLE